MVGTPTVLNSGIQDILQYFVVLRIGIRDDQSQPARQKSAKSHARTRRSVFVCAKVRVEDKSKIEASDKSHLDGGGETDGML